MSDYEFITVFDEGYTEGYASGFFIGLGIGVVGVIALTLLYFVVLK